MSVSNICMLCLQRSDVAIEILNRRGIELNVEGILKEHFGFKVDELKEKSICEKCWRTVHDFHILFTSVKINHQRQSVFYEKSGIIDSNHCNESPKLLDIIKDEPHVDIEHNLDYLPLDVSISETPCYFDVKEINENSTVPKIKRKHNRKLSSSTKTTEKEFETDSQTTLLSTYFNMSCDLCNALLPTYTEAKKHYKNVHSIQKGYLICCSKKYFYLQAMLQHCEWHLNPNIFKCDLCPKTFNDRCKLRDHVSLRHPPESEKLFNCNDCHRVFSKQHYLNAHVKSTHSKHTSATRKVRRSQMNFDREHEMIRNRFLMQCDLCGEPYVVFRDVKMHHAKVHNEAGYLYCCDKKFFRMYSALQHCMWHDDPNSFQCSICQISFVDEISLRDHIRKLHTPKVESSHIHSTLKSHIEVRIKDEMDAKEENQDKQFECHLCGQKFLILQLLQSHIKKVHRNVPAHICELCAKSFSSGQAFRLHYINFHTNTLQKVQCEQCGKWMKNEAGLKKHIQRHNSQSATCGICGRVSINMAALRAHIRRTHREASLECKICGKRLKKKQVLKEHMAIHTGVTDLYTCTFCTKSFRSRANMYSHRKRTHPEQLEQMKASLNCGTTPAATTPSQKKERCLLSLSLADASSLNETVDALFHMKNLKVF